MRTGPVHFCLGGGGGAHTCWSVLPESPPALKTSLSGEGARALFSPPPKSLLNFSIGSGVHEIPQVIPAKIIDEKKKKKKKRSNLLEICPKLPEFYPNSNIGNFLGFCAPCPTPPVSYAYEDYCSAVYTTVIFFCPAIRKV